MTGGGAGLARARPVEASGALWDYQPVAPDGSPRTAAGAQAGPLGDREPAAPGQRRHLRGGPEPDPWRAGADRPGPAAGSGGECSPPKRDPPDQRAAALP